MRFLIDENLPVEIEDHFKKYAEAVHVNRLKSFSRQSIKDYQLRRYALHKKYIIVTRDDDFVKSWVSRKVPEKLIFIYYDGKKEKLLNFLTPHITIVIRLIRDFDFIEVSEKGVRLPFETKLPYK